METLTVPGVSEVQQLRAELGRKFEIGDVTVELRSAAFKWLESGEAPMSNSFLSSVGQRVFAGKSVSNAQVKGVLNWMGAAKKEKGATAKASTKNAELGLAEGRYAVEFGGKLRFYRVDQPDKGKWVGWTFINELVGSGGDFQRLKVSKSDQQAVAALVAVDPLGAMQKFGQEVGKCALCGSPLTDETSRDRGIGPDCWKNKVVKAA